jgi:hypothetical protein
MADKDKLAVLANTRLEVAYQLTDGCLLQATYTDGTGMTTLINVRGPDQSGQQPPFRQVTGSGGVLNIHVEITPSDATARVEIHVGGAANKNLQWQTLHGQVNRQWDYQLDLTVI